MAWLVLLPPQAADPTLTPVACLHADYSCAVQRDMLVHGRLYVTQNYLSFYANLFGWETVISINCHEIEALKKEKTALVIPNAIQVSHRGRHCTCSLCVCV